MLAVTAYDFIRKELKNYNGNYLETGVFDGSGIASLAKEYPEKMFYGIDPFIDDGNTTFQTGSLRGEAIPTIREKAIEAISKFENIKLFECKSVDFKIQPELNISFVLIDGDHSFIHATIDSIIAMELIGEKDGFIIFDDYQVPEVQKAVSLFKKLYKHRIEETNFHFGFKIKKHEYIYYWS